MYMSLCEVRLWCCAGTAAAVVPPLYGAGAFEIQIVSCNRPARCVQDDMPTYTHTHARTEKHRSWLSQLKYAYCCVVPWLPRRQQLNGVTQVHNSSSQHRKKIKRVAEIAPLLLRPIAFLVPTAVGSYLLLNILPGGHV